MDYTTQYICDNTGDAYDVQALSLSNGSDMWYEPWQTNQSDSGVSVNGFTALQNSSVWKALNVLAGDFGQLPVKLFRKTPAGRKEVTGTPEIECLRTRPNPWTVPSVFKETSMWVAALHGNSVTWINRPNTNTIQLVPLRPDRVAIEIDDERQGEFWYVYSLENGTKVPINQEDVLHIQGLTTNGMWGLSLLDVGKNAIGGSLALEKFVNAHFKNGSRPGGVIKHPGKPSQTARDNLRREWNDIHQGVTNAGKVALLAEGMEYQQMAFTLEQSQVEQLRRLDREFVAAWFNLPLYKLNSLEHSATRANLEQQQQEYVQGSLMRWIVRHTEEWARKLLLPELQRAGYYYRVVTEALLRGDTQARYSAYGIAIQNRIMNPNEAREREDMEPYDGGDEFGNPAIDPVDKKAANDVDNKGGRPPESMAVGLLDAAIAHVIKTECNAVCRGVAAKDFSVWCDTYYGLDGGWFKLVAKELKPLADFVAATVGGDFNCVLWASVHAAESQRLLAAVGEHKTKERLADAVKMECDQWVSRAKR